MILLLCFLYIQLPNYGTTAVDGKWLCFEHILSYRSLLMRKDRNVVWHGWLVCNHPRWLRTLAFEFDDFLGVFEFDNCALPSSLAKWKTLMGLSGYSKVVDRPNNSLPCPCDVFDTSDATWPKVLVLVTGHMQVALSRELMPPFTDYSFFPEACGWPLAGCCLLKDWCCLPFQSQWFACTHST